MERTAATMFTQAHSPCPTRVGAISAACVASGAVMCTVNASAMPAIVAGAPPSVRREPLAGFPYPPATDSARAKPELRPRGGAAVLTPGRLACRKSRALLIVHQYA